jgi:hypothetical protein
MDAAPKTCTTVHFPLFSSVFGLARVEYAHGTGPPAFGAPESEIAPCQRFIDMRWLPTPSSECQSDCRLGRESKR